MRRTLLLCTAPALLLAWNWLRLEGPRPPLWVVFLIVALGVAPALAESLRTRVALFALGSLAAAHLALGGSLVGPHPVRPLARFAKGFGEFYAVRLPLDRFEHSRMHGVLLLGLFASCALVAAAISARRALAAVLALLVGAGWPATLLTGGDLLRGTVLLVVLLSLLFGLRSLPRGRLGPALASATLVVAVALGASTSSAIARGQVLAWQNWDFSSAQPGSVSVRYVWSSHYEALRFPSKITTLVEIKAPRLPSYWRATTLELFDGLGWNEDLSPTRPHLLGDRAELTNDPLLPSRARAAAGWTKQQVTVAGLADNHLVAAELPIAYRQQLPATAFAEGGVALSTFLVPRGARYDAWSFESRPSAAQLVRSPPAYPASLAREREVWPGLATPPLGTPGRRGAVEALFARGDRLLAAYRPLYETALRVVGDTRSPYTAALALEAWFRSPVFHYDPRPPAGRGPPLVAFLSQTHRGYCQHFAGAMVLMLRYLGVPARVGAGFTSGSYDRRSGTWRVTDRDAHSWAEVWFRGYGWLPFDPTPGRGQLSGRYTVSSPAFRLTGTLLGRGAQAAGLRAALGISRAHLKLQGARPTGNGAGRAVGAPGVRVGASPFWWLVRLLGLLGLCFLAVFVCAKFALRRARYLGREPRKRAGAALRELADFVADQGCVLGPSLTAAECGERITAQFDVPAAAFAEAATAARYGPPESADAEAHRLGRELRALRRALRRSLTRRERARGLLSLRSLGLPG